MKVLLTGASKGLGIALVKEFASRGFEVWGVARSALDKSRVEGVKGFTYSPCDCSIESDVRRLASDMKKKGFIPDVVIFNAGSAIDDVADRVELDKFKRNFEVNLFGSIAWMEEFLPLFLKRGSGVFAAISSLSVYRENHKNRIAYSSSKLALSKAFENLRMQYFSTGVNFVCFHPGRMSEVKTSLIGTTYADSARIIAENTLKKDPPSRVDFPALHYYLTRLTAFVPDAVYFKHIFR